jgi:nucleotide-binding universal stress UspA family protein
MRLERVLAATDFSPHSHIAAALAATIARAHGAELTLLHADPVADIAPTALPPVVWDRYRADRSRQLQAMLDDQLATLDKAADLTLRARSQLRRDDPVPGILGTAAAWHADVIVMGSHGAHAEEQLLFGSVAAWVSRGAPCPVLVTRADHAQRLPGDGRFRQPLVGVDFSRFSGPAAQFALRLATPLAILELAHVLASPYLEPSPPVPRPDERFFDGEIERACAAGRNRLRDLAERLALPSDRVRCTVEVGRPAQTLIRHLERSENDLVCVGAHGRRTEIEAMLGTVADRVLRHASTPILLIPETVVPAVCEA